MVLEKFFLLAVLGVSVCGCQSGSGQQAKDLGAGDRAELERLKVAAAAHAGEVERLKTKETNQKLQAELALAKANEITAEERELLAKTKAREAGRNELATTPNRLIVAARPTKKERGLVNTYTKVTSIEFSNNSEFDVSDISGHVKFTAPDGSEIGVVPFTAIGDVNAGATETLDVTSGEVTGKADDVEIDVKSVHIRG